MAFLGCFFGVSQHQLIWLFGESE